MRKYITVKYNPELPQLRMQAVLQTNDEVLAARPNINVTGVVTLEGIPLPAGTVSFDGASAFATDAGGTYAGTVPFYYGGNAQMDVYTEPRYTVTPPYRGYYALTANQAAQDYEISINYLILSGVVTDSGTGMVADVTNGTDTWQSAASGSYGYYVPYGWSGTTTAISNGSGTFTPAAYVYNAIGVDYANQDFAFTSTLTPPPVTYLISGEVVRLGAPLSTPVVFVDGTTPLSDWTLASSGTLASIVNNASGAAYNPNTDSFWVPNNSTNALYEYSSSGAYLRTITTGGFADVEAVCWMYGSYFGILEEDTSSIVVAQLLPATGSIYKWSNQVIDTGLGNLDVLTGGGLEGVAYDPQQDVFYAVKERQTAAPARNGMKFYRIEWSGAYTEPWSAPAMLPSYITDLSDVHYDPRTGRAYLLSDDAEAIVEVDAATGSVYQVMNWPSGMSQAEGLSFNPNYTKMWIVGEPNLLRVYTRDLVSVTSDVTTGSYGYLVLSGWSGTSVPSYTDGTFVPNSYSYLSVGANYPNQDFEVTYPPPPVTYYTVSGTFGNESGVPGGLPDFAVTNGTDTWFADSVTGSYAFMAPAGWSGPAETALYITLEGHIVAPLAADLPGQNFTVPTPFMMVADNYFNWNVWPFTVPDRWLISARNPVDMTYSAYATNAGSVYDILIADTGSWYNVRGIDAASNNVTFTTVDTYAAPPLPPIIVLEGSVFNGTDGSGIVTNLYLDGYGTVATDGVGYWSQGMPAPYSGYVSVADPGFDGTFDPPYRPYIGEMLPMTGQDFAFWPTAGPAPTDCQIPLALQTIGDLPTPNAISRSVNDPVNNLLWYVDDSYDYVYYVDAVAGTFQGSIELTNSFGQSAIVYDPTNAKVVVMDWSGSIHVIDPVTKVSTRVPGISMVDPGFHMLAVNDVGTVYATDNRNGAYGSVWAVDPSTATLIRSTKLPIYTDSICWASNINKLVINSGGAGQPAFYIFDPATDTFAASTLLNPAVSFRYENFYIPQTGHMLESFSGGQASAVIDISQGTAATQIATIAPTRVSNADIDTCTDHLFVTNGNYAMWEYTLDGSYSLVNIFDRNGDGINPNSCSHNRQSNLIYVADYADGTIYTYMATRESGSLSGMAWSVNQGVSPNESGGLMTANGSVVTFSGSAAGNETSLFNQYSPDASTSIVNLEAPYPATMTLVYNGSIQDSGTITNASYAYYYMSFNGAGTSFSTTGTNGVFSGTLIRSGTVNTGYNTFTIDTQSYNGGNFIASPCETYVAIAGSLTITTP